MGRLERRERHLPQEPSQRISRATCGVNHGISNRKMRHLQIEEGVSDMITVKRRLLSEEEVTAKLGALARLHNIPKGCYDESAADQMSDFDAQKWLSLCDLLRAARRRSHDAPASWSVPSSLRSIYGK
jgi:hypothetical protein